MSTPEMTEKAPAKINLCLLVGPVREHDGRHELVTVFEPLELHDTVTLEDAAGGADEVVCPGVGGDNLAARALRDFRAATGWDGPPVRLAIDKRIPIAGGMAGGSADAAAALRLARRASGLGDDALLHDLAFALGADVPGQLAPRRLLGTGAGEQLEPLHARHEPYGVLVVPSDDQLATADVFAEADAMGIQRRASDLDAAVAAIRRGRIPRDNDLEPAAIALLPSVADALAMGIQRRASDLDAAVAAIRRGRIPRDNDLEPAAIALLPSVADALDAVRAAGAQYAMVSGSGPTVLGIYPTPDAARAGAEALDARGWPGPEPIVTTPLSG